MDITHVSPGVKPETKLKIQNLAEKSIRFAFAAEEGLVRLANTGSIDEKNILGALISLPNGDIESHLNFFKKNGFFFPISDIEYESIDSHKILGLVNKIKATIRLMSAIEEPQKNYENILHLTLYLLLTPPIEIKVSSMTQPYTTCLHPFFSEISNVAGLMPINREQEDFDKYTYTIPDTIYSPSFELDINDYEEIMGDYMTKLPGASSHLFKSIVNIYCNNPNADINTKLITDFLFHYQYEVGVIQSFTYEDGIKYFSNPTPSNFNESMKSALLKIARIVIGEEINNNLYGIRPTYNLETMSPAWFVDSLMSAIYFSIFYMKPGLELYRQCANPNCKQYFLVKTTSTRNKYCTSECSNATAQRNYRKRQKEKGH